MSVSEKVASRYAEIFVAVFDRIQGDPSSPLNVAGACPQSGVGGKPFVGGNALLTSLVAAERGFGVPVWMTKSKINELGLHILKGERNTPIVKYDPFYEDVSTGKRDPSMDDARYRALSDEERKGWVKRCFMSAWPEWNIAQTNFGEVYPEQWAELQETFGPGVRSVVSCPDIDRLLDASGGGGTEEDTWLCPLVVVPGRPDPSPYYQESHDIIVVAPKSEYADQERYYAEIVHEMSHATGSEGRLDRNLQTDALPERAMEELVAELSGATVCTMLGVQTGVREHNLGFLKSWASVISDDPNVIYRAVNEAARAAEMVVGPLGLQQRPGFSLERLMEGVEEARVSREKAEERRQQRAQAAGGKHRKGWKPVKAPSGGRRR